MSKQPISISRQHSRQHPTISLKQNASQQSSFSQLGPRTSFIDSESEHDLEPLIKQLETQQQAFEQHLYSEMSQSTNTASANQQTPPLTSINPAGILGHRTFGSSTKNASNSFYNVFGKPSTDSPDISTTTSASTIQEHRPKYAQPNKFDRDPRNYQKWKEDCSLYMLAHNNNFLDEHTAIMFMLYHMDKKALVWRMEFMAAHTVSGQGIHLGTMDNFLAALDLAFQPFNMEGDALRQLHALKQLSRPVDEYVSEFRVFTT